MTLQGVTIIDVDELHTHTAVKWWEVGRAMTVILLLPAAFATLLGRSINPSEQYASTMEG